GMGAIPGAVARAVGDAAKSLSRMQRFNLQGKRTMFGDGSLTFREFAMREPHPLASIHDAVLEFLRGRDDAFLYGAQAVNAYVDEPRMTQDVDIASTRAEELAAELRAFLTKRFHIAIRVRKVREGLG